MWLLDPEQRRKASGGVGIQDSSRLLEETRVLVCNRVVVVLELRLELEHLEENVRVCSSCRW